MKERINLGIGGFKPKSTIELDTDLVNIKDLNFIYAPVSTVTRIEIVLEPIYFNRDCICELANVVSGIMTNQTPYMQLQVVYNLVSALDRVKNMKTKDNDGWSYNELMTKVTWKEADSFGLGVHFHEGKDGAWYSPDGLNAYKNSVATPSLLDIVESSLSYLIRVAVKLEQEKSSDARAEKISPY